MAHFARWSVSEKRRAYLSEVVLVSAHPAGVPWACQWYGRHARARSGRQMERVPLLGFAPARKIGAPLSRGAALPRSRAGLPMGVGRRAEARGGDGVSAVKRRGPE